MPKTRIKIRTKRELDARHTPDEAVLAARARRARKAVSSTIEPPTPEQIERFAVGGCGGLCEPQACRPQVSLCRPGSVNDCYHEIATKYGCPLKVASGGQANVDGQSLISFTVEPIQSNVFLPIALRLTARSRDDPDQVLVWRLTAVSIKNKPQEVYHNLNPTATTMGGVESAAYHTKTAGEVPAFEVAWGPFARSAMADHLVLTGWNPYPAGTFMNPRAELWGYPLDALPTGWTCGCHPGRPTVTETPNDRPTFTPSSAPTG